MKATLTGEIIIANWLSRERIMPSILLFIPFVYILLLICSEADHRWGAMLNQLDIIMMDYQRGDLFIILS